MSLGVEEIRTKRGNSPVWCQIQQLSNRLYSNWHRGNRVDIAKKVVVKYHLRPVLKTLEHSRGRTGSGKSEDTIIIAEKLQM